MQTLQLPTPQTSSVPCEISRWNRQLGHDRLNVVVVPWRWRGGSVSIVCCWRVICSLGFCSPLDCLVLHSSPLSRLPNMWLTGEMNVMRRWVLHQLYFFYQYYNWTTEPWDIDQWGQKSGYIWPDSDNLLNCMFYLVTSWRACTISAHDEPQNYQRDIPCSGTNTCLWLQLVFSNLSLVSTSLDFS